MISEQNAHDDSIYTKSQYQKDLHDPSLPHLKDPDRFKSFYEHLGRGAAKNVQYSASRTDWITPKPKSTLLELGCHVGYNLIHWVQVDPLAWVTGVDISSSMIEEAERRRSELPINESSRITLIRDDIETMNHVGFFDDVVLTETLEHVRDPKVVLQRAVDHMALGGNLWITVPTHRWGNYSHVRGIRAGLLSGMLLDVGIKIDNIFLIREKNHKGQLLTYCHATR